MQHLVAHVLELVDSGVVGSCYPLEFVVGIYSLNDVFLLDIKLAEIVTDILILGTLAVCKSEKLDSVIISHDLPVEVTYTDQCLNRLLLPVYGIGNGSGFKVFLLVD